jgi:hypothetical protein
MGTGAHCFWLEPWSRSASIEPQGQEPLTNQRTPSTSPPATFRELAGLEGTLTHTLSPPLLHALVGPTVKSFCSGRKSVSGPEKEGQGSAPKGPPYPSEEGYRVKGVHPVGTVVVEEEEEEETLDEALRFPQPWAR